MTIEPNFDIMLWIIFFTMSLRGFAQIALGLAGTEKPIKYDGGDVIAGIILLAVMSFVVFG